MKKLISLFLSLCLVLTLGSALAEAPAAQPFLGEWTIVTVTTDGEEINYPSMGINFGYTFNEDGTVALFVNGEEIDSARWEEKDGAVTLIAAEDSFDVILEENKLYMTKDDSVMMLMRPQDVPEQTGAQIPGFDMSGLAALFSGEGETGGEEGGLGAMLGGLLGGLFSGEDEGETGEKKEGLGSKIGGFFGGLFSGGDEGETGEEKEGLGSKIGGFFSGLFSGEDEEAEDVSYLPSNVIAAESKEQFFGVWEVSRILLGSDEEPILSLNMQDLEESSDPVELRFTVSDGVLIHLENGEEKAEPYAMEIVDGVLVLTQEEEMVQLYLTDAGEIVINAGILNIFLSPVVEEAETPAA